MIAREDAGRNADLLMILKSAQGDKNYKSMLKKLREFSQ